MSSEGRGAAVALGAVCSRALQAERLRRASSLPQRCKDADGKVVAAAV